MKRPWIVLPAGLVTWLAASNLALAADPIVRGPGFYLAWWKLLIYWLVFLLWVRIAAWVDRDCKTVGDRFGIDGQIWNPIIVFSFFVALLLGVFAMPMFAIGLPIVLLGLFVPLIVFVVQRNKIVTESDRVLTPKHLRHVMSNLGRKKKAERVEKLPWELGPPVNFVAKGGSNDQENQANIIAARQSPGFLPAKELVASALDRRADRVMLDYTRDAVAVRHEIDGVWHNAEARDRESGDAALAVYKKIAALNPTERRARQEGIFEFTYQDAKYGGELLSQGTQTGERAIVKLDHGVKGFESLEKLGMREKMREQLTGLMRADAGGGLILLSAMPAGGLTTLWCATMRATDRMLRDFVCIEEVHQRTPYIENIEVHKYNAAAGESADKVLPKLKLKQPDVYVLPELPDAETVRLLCREVNEENKLVIAAVRAKESVEALLRVLLLKAPADEFAQAIRAVVNVRLIRKLADTCKQPYEPPPQLLQRLGLPAGRIKTLYREWQPNPEDEQRAKRKLPLGACEFCTKVGPSCGGIGYLGRTGIFEMLLVDDKLREALVKQPKLEVLRQIARQSGHKGLQEEGLLLVAQGVTSLNELQRVLKQ